MLCTCGATMGPLSVPQDSCITHQTCSACGACYQLRWQLKGTTVTLSVAGPIAAVNGGAKANG
jgi:hypothetical protein